MRVKTYLNDGPGRFWDYQPGDRLHVGPEVIIPDARTAPSGTPEYAGLDITWAVGNRMDRAWVTWAGLGGAEWPTFVRSLSAGDVLVIGETAWSVAPEGFRVIDSADLARSLGPDAVEDPRGGFGAPARNAEAVR